ncbi:response regulator FixJ [Legionella massiliensis]|uniref:Response regulator FixJ n=1 Tax=Legionella massiliensis TaxID=1034943 RepID=A0A078L634_9GAMM|nr:response regulator [Legionella massiliensis]CDZ79388.1 response regulator FixJ [Legionella massiliensis]CEE15126.1 response regulator FixJ [Legionella massiliensis]
MNQDFKAFYFKTEVVLTDDNENFLNALNHKLSNNYLLKPFPNPNNALNYIVSSYENNLIANASNFIKEASYEDDDNYFVEFSKIRSLADNSQRNKVISVVIVDYSMPLMNGIEFCEKISHLPILKIMLTGHADFNVAINAFNRGIIDRFLLKDSKNMLYNINESIDIMQKTFFEKQSFPLLSCLSANKNTLVSLSEYSNHFKDIVKNLNAIEYYVLDTLGSYLIISEQGHNYYFIVLTNTQLDELIDVAQSSNVAPDLLEKIVNKTHAPIFLKEEDYKVPALNWENLLYPLEKRKNYYYCLIEK